MYPHSSLTLCRALRIHTVCVRCYIAMRVVLQLYRDTQTYACATHGSSTRRRACLCLRACCLPFPPFSPRNPRFPRSCFGVSVVLFPLPALALQHEGFSSSPRGFSCPPSRYAKAFLFILFGVFLSFSFLASLLSANLRSRFTGKDFLFSQPKENRSFVHCCGRNGAQF